MLGVMLIERSAIEYTKNIIPSKLHYFLLRLNIVELVLIMFLTISSLNFRYVELHAFYGMFIVVFSAHLYTFYKTKNEGSRYILKATGVLVISLIVFNYPITPHVWFNHNDFAHILMAIGSYLFLQGALKFKKPPESISK